MYNSADTLGRHKCQQNTKQCSLKIFEKTCWKKITLTWWFPDMIPIKVHFEMKNISGGEELRRTERAQSIFSSLAEIFPVFFKSSVQGIKITYGNTKFSWNITRYSPFKKLNRCKKWRRDSFLTQESFTLINPEQTASKIETCPQFWFLTWFKAVAYPGGKEGRAAASPPPFPWEVKERQIC